MAWQRWRASWESELGDGERRVSLESAARGQLLEWLSVVDCHRSAVMENAASIPDLQGPSLGRQNPSFVHRHYGALE